VIGSVNETSTVPVAMLRSNAAARTAVVSVMYAAAWVALRPANAFPCISLTSPDEDVMNDDARLTKNPMSIWSVSMSPAAKCTSIWAPFAENVVPWDNPSVRLKAASTEAVTVDRLTDDALTGSSKLKVSVFAFMLTAKLTSVGAVASATNVPTAPPKTATTVLPNVSVITDDETSIKVLVDLVPKAAKSCICDLSPTESTKSTVLLEACPGEAALRVNADKECVTPPVAPLRSTMPVTKSELSRTTSEKTRTNRPVFIFKSNRVSVG
jgi:hypothetical protein